MDTNNRIKELRKQAGLTQGQLGEFLNVDQSMIAKLECGDRKLTTVQLSKLSDLFGCKEEYLLGSANTKEQANLAFRIDKMGSNEMEVIASVNKVAKNINLLNAILEEGDEK